MHSLELLEDIRLGCIRLVASGGWLKTKCKQPKNNLLTDFADYTDRIQAAKGKGLFVVL
jgi:hypothetical protein